jgi:hypothetical protein
MERKIGERFQWKDRILGKDRILEVCVDEDNACEKCFFCDYECNADRIRNDIGQCIGRPDGASIYFKEVNKKEDYERQVGDVFEWDGKKIVVKETERTIPHMHTCEGNCIFYKKCHGSNIRSLRGYCAYFNRKDGKTVYFAEYDFEKDGPINPKTGRLYFHVPNNGWRFYTEEKKKRRTIWTK